MNRQQFLSSILLVSLLALGVVPSFQASAQTCDPDALEPVYYGQRGSAVRNAQACLLEAGYDIPAGATGYYGAQTKAAVKEFYSDWYGPWHGNNLGPRGVAQLQSMLAGEVEEQEEQSSQVNQQVLAEVLALLLQGKTAEALALLSSVLNVSVPTSTPTSTTSTPQEGFLVVDLDPTVVSAVVREGESAKVFGLRFRADNGPVSVKSIFLRWTGSVAPWRVISKLELVDSQGNVLFSRDVDSNTFLQDANLNYYLPVTGLNVNVPVNQYVSVFVQVNVVGTLPSGVSSAGFKVEPNDVRARDGVGIDRFGPASTLTGNFTLQPSLAGSASFDVAKNVNNSPKEGYVFGDVDSGLATNVKLLSFDVTARNDNIRLKEVKLQLSNSSAVATVYLKQGNRDLAAVNPTSNNVTLNVVPAEFYLNQDQKVTFDVVANLRGGQPHVDTNVSTTVTEVVGLNSLGESVSASNLNVVGPTLHYRTLGPEVSNFAITSKLVTDDDASTTDYYEVKLSFDVNPSGGTIYMGATGTVNNVTTTFVDLKLEPPGVSPSSIEVSVYEGNTNVTNSLPATSTGLFVLSRGQTYTFKIIAQWPKGTTPDLRKWVVKALYWSYDGSTSNLQSMYWTEQDMQTDPTTVYLP